MTNRSKQLCLDIRSLLPQSGHSFSEVGYARDDDRENKERRCELVEAIQGQFMISTEGKFSFYNSDLLTYSIHELI